jgi:hypothetical protein
MALNEADIKVIIAAELKKAGFDKAERATKSLTKSFNRLGAAVGVALSGRAIINFAKQGAIAFAQEEKAVKQLTNSLANLGFAYSVPQIERYLEATEKATLVTKEELRPAIVQLISTTMSAKKSMALLGTALDIAAETGADVGQVTTAITRAYNGNFTAISKLSRGYTSAELKAKGFEGTIELLSARFSGSAAASTDTYAFKIGQLQKAFGDAQKEVGKGLIKAIEQLGSGDYDKGLQNLVDAGTDIGNAFGYAAGAVNTLKQAYDLITGRFVRTGVEKLLGKNQPQVPRGGTVTPSQFELAKAAVERRKEAAIRAKELAERKKLAALEAAERRKRAAELKKEQQLKRAGTVFDMEAIQLVAALQNRVTEENRLRLTALLAIYSENAEAADKLTQAVLMLQKPALENLGITLKTGDTATDVIAKIINAQTRLFLLNTGIATIPKAKNPFEDWDSILDRLLAKINAIKNAINGFGSNNGGNTGGNNNPNKNPSGSNNAITANPTDPSGVNIVMPNGNIANPFTTFTVNGATIIANSGTVMTGQPDDSPNEANARQRIADIFSTIGTFGAGGFQPANVTVNVAGNVMSNDDLIQVITEGLYEVQKRGQSITLNAVAL